MKVKNTGLALIVVIFLSIMLLGATSENGKTNINLPYETQGQNHLFVSPTGTGDCSSWDRACTFQVAATKCTSNNQDVIWLGAGFHDLNNGVDATGTTLSADHIRIEGISCDWAASSKLGNSHATATHVLTVTGDNFEVDRAYFSNTGQTDENVIFLTLTGVDGAQINRCRFVQDGAVAVSGTGILLDGSSARVKIEGVRASFIQGVALDIPTADRVLVEDSCIIYCTTGIAIGSSRNFFEVKNVTFDWATTGVTIGASTDHAKMTNCSFTHCTTNITNSGVYDGLHVSDIEVSHPSKKVYPATTGTSVSTGDGVWTWTAAATTIIPKDAITKIFAITGVNVQDYDASQTYKVQLFYGENAANIDMGIYEFTVGATIAGQRAMVSFDIAIPIPNNSIVGMKLMSSTAGVDSIVVTLNYEEI